MCLRCTGPKWLSLCQYKHICFWSNISSQGRYEWALRGRGTGLRMDCKAGVRYPVLPLGGGHLQLSVWILQSWELVSFSKNSRITFKAEAASTFINQDGITAKTALLRTMQVAHIWISIHNVFMERTFNMTFTLKRWGQRCLTGHWGQLAPCTVSPFIRMQGRNALSGSLQNHFTHQILKGKAQCGGLRCRRRRS